MKNNKLLSLSVLSVMVASTLASGAVFAQETTTPATTTTTTATTATAEATTTAAPAADTATTATTAAPEATATATAPAATATVSTQKVTLNLTKEGTDMHYKMGAVSSTDASGATSDQAGMKIKQNQTFQIGFDSVPANVVSHFETAGLETAYMCPDSNDALGLNWSEYKTSVDTKVTDAAAKESCLKDFYVVYLGTEEVTVPAETDFIVSDTAIKSIGGFQEINGAFTPTTEFQIVTTNEELVETTTEVANTEAPKAEETKPVDTKETGLATNLLLIALAGAALVGRKVMKNM